MNATVRAPSALKTTALLLLCLCLLSCGGQVVEFPLDCDSATACAPVVISTVPVDAAVAVGLTAPISVTFSHAMDGTTLTVTSFLLMQGSTPVLGAVTFDHATNTATFTPAAPLELDRRYTAWVTTEATDRHGRSLVKEYVWTFTSGTIEVFEFAATAVFVPAPDYVLTVDGLALRVDANNVVQSATGAALLTAGQVTGQRYVVAAMVGLGLYSEIDDAYLAGADHALAAGIPAADFSLVGADLTTPEARTLILANLASGVRAYQVFEIIFHPPQ